MNTIIMETVACAVCGGTSAAPARIRNPRDDLAAAYGLEDGRSRWVVCDRCGLVFQSPRPDEEAIEDLYVGGDYHANRGGLPEHYIEYSLRRSVPALDWCLEVLRDEPGRVLDIGAGIGGALVRLRDCGWETTGVEPDDTMAALGRSRFGLDIETGFFSAETFDEGTRFDLAYSCHVWEHLTDPVAVAKAARGVLRPGGHIFIVVPTFRQAKKNAWECFSTAHNYMFTDVSLGNVLRMSGFEVVAHRYETDADAELWLIARAVDAGEAESIEEDPPRIQRELSTVPLRIPLGMPARARKHVATLTSDPADFAGRAIRYGKRLATRAARALGR